MTTEYSNLTSLPNFSFTGEAVKRLPPQFNIRRSPFTTFLSSLAVNNQDWEIRVHRCNSYNDPVEIRIAHIRKNGEQLGVVKYDYHGRTLKFYITNDRINSELARGSFKVTADINKAISIVGKYFRPKNDDELMESAVAEASRFIRQLRFDTERQREGVKMGMRITALDFALDNREAFSAFLATRNEAGKLDNMDNLNQSVKQIDAINNTNSALVIAKDGEYVVRCLEFPDGKVMQPNELPIRFWRNLGMLKLTEKGAFVGDVGCRVDDNIYIVKEFTSE